MERWFAQDNHATGDLQPLVCVPESSALLRPRECHPTKLVMVSIRQPRLLRSTSSKKALCSKKGKPTSPFCIYSLSKQTHVPTCTRASRRFHHQLQMLLAGPVGPTAVRPRGVRNLFTSRATTISSALPTYCTPKSKPHKNPSGSG